MTTDLVRAYYDAQAETYQNKFADEIERKPYDRDFLERFSKVLLLNSRVLDVGCASSCQQARFLAKSFKVTAIDLSPENVAVAKRKFSELDVRTMNMLSMDFKDAEFDAINAFYSVIHIPSQQIPALFLEFRRVLRAGGKLSIAVHKGSFEGIVEGENVYFTAFTKEFLLEALEAAGFRVLSADERKPIYEFEYQSDRLYLLAEKI